MLDGCGSNALTAAKTIELLDSCLIGRLLSVRYV
jgi:hypothetical protein